MGVIVACIAYPWSTTLPDNNAYDVTGGTMMFLYNSRKGQRIAAGEIIPDFVSSLVKHLYLSKTTGNKSNVPFIKVAPSTNTLCRSYKR